MKKPTLSLDNVRVASPCTARWDAMQGDDRSRFCSECKLSVYNLSAMTKTEAEEFVAGAEGRVCIRYYQRADGTMLTADCPVGVQAVRMRFTRRVRSIAAAAIALVATGAGVDSARAGGSPKMGKMMPTVEHTDTTNVPDTLSAPANESTVTPVEPTAPPEEMGQFMMGGMIAPMPEAVEQPEPPSTVVEDQPEPTSDLSDATKPTSREETPYNGPATVVPAEVNTNPVTTELLDAIDVNPAILEAEIADEAQPELSIQESELEINEVQVVVNTTPLEIEESVAPETIVEEPHIISPEAIISPSRLE